MIVFFTYKMNFWGLLLLVTELCFYEKKILPKLQVDLTMDASNSSIHVKKVTDLQVKLE